MSKFQAILLLVLTGLSLAVQAEEIPIVTIDEDVRVISAAGNFIYCIQEGQQSCANEDFELLKRNVLAKGFISGQVTLLTKLVNTTDLEQNLKIEVANPSLNNVLIEVFADEEWIFIDEFSDLTSFHKRSFFHRNFVLPFTMEPFEEVMVRITIGVQREPIFMPVRICSDRYFLQSSVVEFLMMGGLIGMYTIYIIFILGLFLLWRSKLFLYYALINLFVLTYCLFDTGFGFQYLWPTFPIFQSLIIPIIAFAYLMALISFTREFFSTPIKYPAMDKVLVAYMVINVLIFIAVIVMYNIVGLPLIIPLALQVTTFLVFGLTVAALGLITYLQSGRREGFWFVLLFTLYLVMFGFILNQKGYLGFFIIQPDSKFYYHLPVFTSTPHYIFVIMMAEMLIVSAIIAFRFRDVLEEYNITQRRIEDVNRNSIKAFIRGQEAERESLAISLERNIGVELNSIQHDIQTIVAKKKQLVMANSLDHVEDVQDDLKRIASDFVIDWGNVSLKELVNRVFNDLKAVLPDVRVIVDIGQQVNELDIGDLTRLNLYRILQEACNNIIKHANSTEVHARFEQENAQLEVSIDDDGVGFEVDSVDLKQGIGLRNMETRIKALNGTIRISSTPGVGTRIELTIPTGLKKGK